MKRLFDLAAGLAGLVLLGWLVLILALLVRLSSPGPGLFRQTRMGHHQRPFTCLKLRTMALATPDLPSHEVGAAAVTPLGRTLRRFKLDELPQLWNVVKGEMSLVGPRPCLPGQTLLIAERERRGVYALRPGITGLAQVMGIDMSDPVRLAEVDALYLRTRSFGGDLRLLLQTVAGRGGGDRVGASSVALGKGVPLNARQTIGRGLGFAGAEYRTTLPSDDPGERKHRAKVRNERLKLLASWLNAVSIALLGAAVLVPAIAGGNAAVLAHWTTWVWIAGAGVLHGVAQTVLGYLRRED